MFAEAVNIETDYCMQVKKKCLREDGDTHKELFAAGAAYKKKCGLRASKNNGPRAPLKPIHLKTSLLKIKIGLPQSTTALTGTPLILQSSSDTLD